LKELKMKNNIKKVLILGSGALKIGEAGEFDYSGSQAIKTLKEEGIRTVLVNPNIATIQTSKELADEVYFLPITPYFVEKILAKEKPDGILLSFGGQTALNCGLELNKTGILKKHNVTILGTPVKAIQLTEDRDDFAKHLHKINIPTPISQAATSLKKAELIAKKLGFPLMIRAGYTLGGQGSGVATDMEQLKNIATKALAFAPQILIEQYLYHYKEIEYEVVRDQYDNCITVCNMENMDPLGIHTGESIVVAPSQTLTNDEYFNLRKASIDIVKSLGIVGECNVQFALNPKPKKGKFEYYVIEVNARLSRSSALASKATGYPLAYIAAKLALGYNLSNLENKITGVTSACFEPALDYIVVKMPRWDLDKFKGADQKLGSSMKSVGEVMGIGRTFEEAFQKAIRMLDLEYEDVTSERLFTSDQNILELVKTPTPKRMFALAKAIKKRISIKKIYELSGIDPWFLHRIKNIVDHENELSKVKKLTPEKLLALKQIGVSDKRIGELLDISGLDVRALRKKYTILPSILQIDTLAAEFPAQTNYLYTTYNAEHTDVTPSGKNAIIVLGSGPYHIGSSVEFDWCSVNTVTNLKKYNKKSIIINCNPETVSTDYDISDRLYFEELTFERIMDIYEFENPTGIIVSVGGQTPNKRAQSLHNYGANILGTNAVNIDKAEDRNKFSTLLDKHKIQQPAWQAFSDIKTLESFVDKIGFPVVIRPSYVLSGSAMNVCYSLSDIKKYLEEATKLSPEYPVTISKFFEQANEIELDAVAQNGILKAGIISEHVEYAGVHSGDATIVLPADNVAQHIKKEIIEIGKNLAKELEITGPFNIQFLLKNNKIYIIETNLRASRTFPFIAKVTGINLIELFVKALFQKDIAEVKNKKLKYTAVKVAQFSFARLTGAHPKLGVEMASTGEVACFGNDREEAYLKGILATGGKIPERGIFISLGGDKKKKDFLTTCKLIGKLNLPLYTTEKTHEFLSSNGIKSLKLYKIYEKKSPNIIDYFRNHKIDLVINIVDKKLLKDLEDSYEIRREATDSNITLFTKNKNAELFIHALINKKLDKLEIKPWSEYVTVK
jgi:carbamoyl-phosphate synthase large subunit